ncbi:hypothetical protein BJX96DRAFT_174587 [Aspergillus floccosus]
MATEDSRKRLDDLHKALVEHMEGPLLGLQEVNPQDLAPFNIECLSFDLEASDDEIPSIEPLYLFGPLAQKTLDEHPIDLNMKMAIHQSRSYTSLNVPGSVMSMRISCSSRPGSWTCLNENVPYVSFVERQHGKIFYAHMKGKTLWIY